MIVLPVFDTVALRLGPLEIHWYGLMYVVGFCLAWVLGRVRCKKPWINMPGQEMDDLLTALIFGLVVGARLGYVIFYDPMYFLRHPVDIVAVWKGGMSFHGGMIGMALAAVWHGRRTGRGFLGIADFVAPLAPPGLFFGRIGNFINGELWGRETTVPWGMVFPDPAAGFVARHPSQLYESFLEGLVLFIILWTYSGKARPRGAVLGMFLFCYGLFRFSVEFVRNPDAQLGYVLFGWMTMGQILCLPMLAIGAWLMARRPGTASGPGPA